MIDSMDVSEILECFSQPVILKRVTKTSVDFVESESDIESTIDAVVQPADPKRLNSDNIDWSQENLQVHTKAVVDVGQFIEYKSKDYKVVVSKNYSDYGYYDIVIEATNRTVK